MNTDALTDAQLVSLRTEINDELNKRRKAAEKRRGFPDKELNKLTKLIHDFEEKYTNRYYFEKTTPLKCNFVLELTVSCYGDHEVYLDYIEVDDDEYDTFNSLTLKGVSKMFPEFKDTVKEISEDTKKIMKEAKRVAKKYNVSHQHVLEYV